MFNTISTLKPQIIDLAKSINKKYKTTFQGQAVDVLSDISNYVSELVTTNSDIIKPESIQVNDLKSSIMALIIKCFVDDDFNIMNADIEEVIDNATAAKIILDFMNKTSDENDMAKATSIIPSRDLQEEYDKCLSEHHAAVLNVNNHSIQNFDNHGNNNKVVTLTFNM